MELYNCSIGKRCHQRIHILFTADIVGFVQDVLFLLLVKTGIAVMAAVLEDSANPKPMGT